MGGDLLPKEDRIVNVPKDNLTDDYSLLPNGNFGRQERQQKSLEDVSSPIQVEELIDRGGEGLEEQGTTESQDAHVGMPATNDEWATDTIVRPFDLKNASDIQIPEPKDNPSIENIASKKKFNAMQEIMGTMEMTDSGKTY